MLPRLFYNNWYQSLWTSKSETPVPHPNCSSPQFANSPCCTNSILTVDHRYPPAWMTNGGIARHVAWLAPLTPQALGRWQREGGTPTQTMPGAPTALRATCWRNSTTTEAGPPRRWAESFSSMYLLMVSSQSSVTMETYPGPSAAGAHPGLLFSQS